MAKAADAEEIIQIYNKLDGDKSTLRSHLSEIADYMVPTAQSTFNQATFGGKRMTKIYDGTAGRALRTFASGLYGHLTSPAYPWFELTVKNKSISEVPAVKYWLAHVTERVRSAINTSNSASEFYQVYYDEGWTGTGVLFTQPGKKYLINFQAFNIANCCLLEDAQGVVDSIYRVEKFTARQMIQQWGAECSEAVHKAYNKGDKNKTFDVIHAVYPRNEYNWKKQDNLNMPYASVYLEKESKKILAEGGFQEFPYATPRWDKESGVPYGRSPAMDALPDVKMLNQMRYDNLRGLQKSIDPPIFADTEAALSTTNTRAGGIIYHKSGHVPQVMTSKARFDWALEAENQAREQVKESFYTDLFMLLAQNPSNDKTAYEVSKLLEEKLTLLGPALGRQQTEFFDSMLSRVFWILYRAKYIPPPPEELIGQGLEVNYIGRLAMAMKQVETQATANTLSFIGGLFELAPDIMDNFNTDEIAQGTAQRAGMPVNYLRPPGVRDKMREQRAAAQAEAQAKAEASQDLADAANIMPALSKAPERGSVAGEMMNG